MAEEESSGAGSREGLRLIVGLGNPGDKYEATRHNIGFRIVEEVSRRLDLGEARTECRSRISGNGSLYLVQPQTFMNRSGLALRCLWERYGYESQQVLVVYDEVHLPLGRLRLRTKGGPGGHRGMESIIENLRTEEVHRLRCGVGPADADLPGDELVPFVLGAFDDSEQEVVDEMITAAAEACMSWLEDGAETAMNRFNR
ncbi:MAG: aminoacyl-tRNA hydrolase [Deltaproteobacteria bacterium]|nr:aminoacyl-tRNA hydrolase [Deltaproteobacteria bacterium]